MNTSQNWISFGPSKTSVVVITISVPCAVGLLIALASAGPAQSDALIFKMMIFALVSVTLALIILPFALISTKRRVLISLNQKQIIISGKTYAFEAISRATLTRVVPSFTDKGAVGPRYELVFHTSDGKSGKVSIDHRDRVSSLRTHVLSTAVEHMTSLAETTGVGSGRHVPTTPEPIEVGRQEILDTMRDRSY